MFKTIILSAFVLGTTLPTIQPVSAAVAQAQADVELHAWGTNGKIKFEAVYTEETIGGIFGQKFVIQARGPKNTKVQVWLNEKPFGSMVFNQKGEGFLAVTSDGGSDVLAVKPGHVLNVGGVKGELVE